MKRKLLQNAEYLTIGVVAEMTQVHPQTLRYYERVGLITPKRGKGNVRFYTQSDVERIRRIKVLTQDMGVNLAGVEIILRLSDQLEKLRQEKEALEHQKKGDEGNAV
ncbi:MAG: MerR family transcriptional regulator [Candidatus Caldatribacterium sp.]|uniref:heat shock protein transcriptional repressor HspR n=1 Tax=Candidatus Caldatribacterium sp. TaxID=2282143 RepID=UPI002990CCB5|nr:MerR family transcriptional regulator [Candidatus Caldatribacterium sp.]MCX7730158.1 MerR family transcriptional regulator [Candidatus Caldatribacterium sp.]MDW8080677.1 MerR family transcriptional regulator [Candidatus Calescibacterium sp.]